MTYIKDIFGSERSKGGILLGALCSLLAMQSCSDDIDVKKGLKDPLGNDCISITIEMPEAEHVLTRALDDSNERKITDLTLLVFDKNDELLKRIDLNEYELVKVINGFESEDRSYTYQLAIDEEEISNQNIGKIVAAANYRLSGSSDLLAGFVKGGANTSFEDFLNISSNVYSTTNGFIMSGIKNDSDRTLKLTRTAAKISLKNEFESSDFELYNFAVYNIAKDCYLPAEVRLNQNKAYYRNTINSSEQKVENVVNMGVTGVGANVTFDYTDECYVNPTLTHEDLKVYTYVVMYANYYGKNYYYAVPLYYSEEKEDGTKDEGYYNIEPNHWYDMRIKNVLKEGENTPEDAIKYHNNNQIWVEIHDHNPKIFTMLSDGIHELGVTREIRLDNSHTSEEITVKCYAADMDQIDLSELQFEYDDWITLEQISQTDYVKDKEDGVAQNPDTDNPGKEIVYRVTIDTNRAVYAEETSYITVKWKGLKREIAIVYDPGFKISNICKATLTIKPDTGAEKVIQNYWTFVTGNGTSPAETSSNDSESGTPVLYGIKSDDLVNGKVRTAGFHFPMPYGNNYNTNPWEYIYNLDFSHQVTPEGSTIDVSSKIESITVTPSAEMVSNVKWTPNGSDKSKGTLEWVASKTSYTYEGGTINFKVKYTDGTESTDLTLSIYHTGFFHYDGDSKYCPSDDWGYYYYEVVPMGSGYWLDRNIGAKGSLRYVDTEDSTNPIGDRKYGGRLFTIATPEDFKGATVDYGMCPPGYHIPNQGEWDDVRLTSNFTSQAITSGDNSMFVSTFYRTNNAKIGNVYFQKVRFYNGNNVYANNEKYTMEANVGDAGGGYYWTTSIAPAMEKQYMGNWFRALYLIGSSASYNNASVYDHRMVVRCKAGVPVTETQENYVSINAHNVTHVFLFDKESKTPLYNFPGKALGSASSSSSWQYFYCSTTLPLDQILMLFAKVDADGKVTLYTKKGNKFDTEVNYGAGILNETYAWKVERGKYYDFCDAALERADGIVTEEQPDECDASQGGGNSGGGGENDNSNKGERETQRGPWDGLTPEGLIIWEGSKEVNWDETKIDCNFWKQVPPGSKLRIYGFPTNSNSDFWAVGIRGQGWKNYFNTADGAYQYNKVNGFVEIELDEAFLAEIIEKNMMVTGSAFILRYVTIILNGELLEPDLMSGNYSWSGSLGGQNQWNDYMMELKSDNYNWSIVTGGTLTIEYTQYSDTQLIIKYGNGETLASYTPWAINGQPNFVHPVVIQLTGEILTNIKNKGGVYLSGGNYVLKSVDLVVTTN